MKRAHEWTGVPALLDELVATADVGHRDRILLDAVARQEWVLGAALWRPASDGPGFGARWHQVLARGPADRLPDRDVVHSVVRGERQGDFYPGLRLVTAGDGCEAFVLAVAADAIEEEAWDLLEALLCVFGATGESAAGGDVWAPLLPRTADGKVEHDLRNLLTGIQATQELLESYGDDLSDDEVEHFGRLLDNECGRAGDLLGSVLSEPEPGAGLRPARWLEELAAECEGAALEIEAGARRAECPLAPAPLRAGLRRMVRALAARASGLRLIADRPAEDALRLRLVRDGEAVSNEDAAALEGELERAGARVTRRPGGWDLHLPARDAA